ncbi:hypothetical protein PC128_g13129 [Phytophthora cactorum]|nr:hypothetical protein PC128_g13129 [Phytophthora cactorum]
MKKSLLATASEERTGYAVLCIDFVNEVLKWMEMSVWVEMCKCVDVVDHHTL